MPTYPLRNALVRIALPLAAAAVMALGTYNLYHWSQGTPSLDQPGHTVRPATENMGAVMAVSHQPSGVTTQGPTVRIGQADESNFRRHFENIALQRGWYVDKHKRNSIRMVIPAQELPALREIAEDPLGWVSRNDDPATPGSGPSSVDLVRAELTIELDGMTAYYTGALLTALAALAGYACLVTAMVQAINTAKRRLPTATAA